MSLDTVIDLPCRAKKDLGSGDVRAGTRVMLGLLRTRDRADAGRVLAGRAGAVADDYEVRETISNPDGSTEDTFVSVGELAGRAAALDPHAAACTNCPANARRKPFGCAGLNPAAVSGVGEEWLLDRLQPADAVGGAVALQSVNDLGYDGTTTREARGRGAFEDAAGRDRPLPKNAFGRASITTDELLHPLFAPGGRLNPWQCLNLLLWFGAVKIDDAVPQTPADALKLTRLEPPDRAKRAKLAPGPAATDPGVDPLRDVFKAAFVAWVRDVDLLIES